MLTDISRRRIDARGFVLRAVAWSLGVFGLLRLTWTEAHVVLPFTRAQGGLAVGLFGTPTLPVEVTLACSGADALALCLGAVLAYPVRWRSRLAGAGGGVALILALNTLRIGTLGRAAASPAWFNTLHLYVWPAVLTLAIAGYVLGWMRLADRRPPVAEPTIAAGGACSAAPPSPLATAGQVPPSPLATARQDLQPSRRFVVLTVVFLLLFSAASPLYLESTSVLALGGFIARAAAWTMGIFGVSAHATANVLLTGRGGFVVTQECISTPLVPVYLAAICAYSTTWRRLLVGVLATLPIFTALGIGRLLVVALPDAVLASPLFFVHAFYQLLLGALVVFLAALWRHGRPTALRHALVGLIVGVLLVCLLGPLLVREVAYLAGAPLDDPQGAIAFLPAFQVGLYVALWVAAFVAVGWTRFLAGLAVLGLMQAAGLLMLHELAGISGLTVHVRDVRAWAVVGPVLVFAAVVHGARTRRYRDFWAGVGERFPDLAGAVSTRYYSDNERRLFTEHFPTLDGLRILKTDLWDEAKNTRILAWASRQGARVYGIDIAEPTVIQARAAFETGPDALHGAVGDVRAVPFRDASFDAVYSMGTIEHFDETEHAVEEIARVLKPGGRAIVGVPNRYDPFLRPLFATALQAVGLYGYGYEKSYSRRALRQMLERVGLEVVAETAILFIPGWLRMLDLACHAWCRPLAVVTGALVRPFVFLDRHVPAVRRHGYLLATVVSKPDLDLSPKP